MNIVKPGDIWEVELADGEVVELRRRGLPDISGGMWDTLNGSELLSSVYSVLSKVDYRFN
jgi:hypothetical protein